MPSTPVPDDADQERMHKYMTDRRVIGVRFYASTLPLQLKLSSSPAKPLHRPSKPIAPPAPLAVQYDPLIQPALIRHEITSSPVSQKTVAQARFAASRIIAGEDDRVIVIVGPCSIHSPEQAIAYAKMLREDMPRWDGLLIIMRAYL